MGRIFEQGVDVDPNLVFRVASGLAGNTTENHTWQTVVDWLQTFNPIQQIKTDFLDGTEGTSSAVAGTYVDAGLLVSITAKSASAKFIIESISHYKNPTTETGVKIRIQYKIGAAAWADLLKPSQSDNGRARNTYGLTQPNQWFNVKTLNETTFTLVPGTVYQFRLTYSPFASIAIDCVPDDGDVYMKVSEILI